MSGAALATSPDIVFIGVDASHALCDLTFIAGDSFGPTNCHPELEVWLGNDLPAPPPQLVALHDGDAVAIYATSFVDITAVVLHDGKRSSPVTAAAPQLMYSFAAAVAPRCRSPRRDDAEQNAEGSAAVDAALATLERVWLLSLWPVRGALPG